MSDPWSFLIGQTGVDDTPTYQPQQTDNFYAGYYQQQQQYQPQPQQQDQFSQGDPWSFLNQTQYQPYWQPQPQQPQTDPFSYATATAQAYRQPQDQGFFGNLWNAVSSPWQEPTKQGMNPFEFIGDTTRKAAESVIGGTGAALQPVGDIVDQAADSNIPILDPLANATRWTYENVAEPALNATPALIGTLAESVDTRGSVNPFDWQFNRNAARQGWDENDPDQVYQRTLQSELAAGKSQQEAVERATREKEKMQNPLNRMFKSGTEEFSTLNPVAQLAVGVVDPVQNVAGRYLFGKPLEAAGAGLGKVADVTGLSKVGDTIADKLESPQQYNAKTARENYFANQVLTDAEAALGSPEAARSAVFEQPDSPWYWEKQGIDSHVAEASQYFLQAQRQEAFATTPDAARGQTTIPQSESELAQRMQNPNPELPTAPVKADPFSLPEQAPAVDTALATRPPSELDEFFPESTRATAAPTNTVEIPDHIRNAIGIPAKTATHDEFLTAVQQKLGYEKKAYKLAGTVGNPRLVETKPLEQFGMPGKIVGALGWTLPYMSRAFLNSSGRAVRDMAGNLAKYVAEGFSFDRGAAPRFEKVNGRADTAPLGRASVAAEVGKEPTSDFKTNLFFHAINPFNELSSDALRFLTKGKYKDWNDFTEKNESGLKTSGYKQEFLKNFDATADNYFINKGAQDFSQYLTPQDLAELGPMARSGTLTPETLQDWLKGKMPKGASLTDALANRYNPLNLSDEVRAAMPKVFDGTGGPAGNIVFDALNSLQERINASNAAKKTQYDAAMAKLEKRPPKNPKLAETRRKTLQAIYQQTRPDKLEDVVPGHPLWTQMEKDILDNLTLAQKSAATVEQVDPNLQKLVRGQIYQALVWAAKDGKLQNLKRVLARDIAQREAGYKQYETPKELPAPDLGRMMDLKERYEVGARMTPAEVKEYETWRDATPIRDMAQQTGVQLPETFSIFDGANDLAGIQKIIKQAENFKSTPDDEFGGTPLTAVHQKELAQALVRNDRLGFNNLVAEIKRNPRYTEGITGADKGKTGLYTDRTRANADRTVNRLEKYWDDFQNKGEAPVAPPDPLSDFGAGTRYHGTSQEFDLKPGYEYDQSANLYGPGLYTTDNLDVAKSYQKKGAGKSPAVYKVDWTGQNKPNLLNLEKPFPDNLRQQIQDFFSDDSVGFRPEFDWSKPAKDLYGDFKQALIDRDGPGLTSGEAQEILYTLSDEIFRPAGYDGFSHIGGQKMGKDKVQPHNVAVLFDPRDFENGNKVNLSKYEEPINTLNTPQTGISGLPQTTPDFDLQAFQDAVGNPQINQLPVEDGMGNVLTPETLQKMAGKWNRTATYDENGNVYNGPLTREQREQYRRDFLATDEYWRRVSNNQFKLDPDTFSPVRISDGVSLDELTGRSRPETLGEPLPQLPADFPTDMEGVVKAIEGYMGPDAYKLFALMKQEGDQAGIDMAYSDIARAMGFPDPTNLRTGTEKMGMETDQAREYLKMLADDATQRKTTSNADLAKGQADEAAYQKQAEELAQKILAARTQLVTEAGRRAYDKIENTFFDYQNKNVLDQMVGSLLPFGYWGRRNFAYVAKYFAAHPTQYAAVLNFYKNVEQQNQQAGGIPDYALGNLLLWTNPDGSKVLWNFSSAMPFNPLGDSDSLLQLVGPDDDSQTVNKSPLAMLFGADRTNSKGEVTGRDKGILSTFLRPNPVIDILTKTGKVNEIMKDLGWTTDGFGSPGPSSQQTVSLIPSRTQIRDIAARTGLTQLLRTELGKAGIKLDDLDLEGPINNLLFGTNSGKPITAVVNELTEMAQGDPKNKNNYLTALAKLKQGNWTPEALKALDTVEAQTAWQRAATLAGFSSVIANTPREQLAGQIYGGYNQVAGDKGHYNVTTDPKTGKVTRTYVEGEGSKFFDNNAGANVLFAKNKNPDQINQSVENDKTSTELDKVYKAYDAGKFDLRTRNKLLDDLRRGNPTYFSVQKDKDYQQAKGELPYLPGEENLSVDQVDQKYFKQENPNERAYSEWKDDLYRAGGDRYQQLNDQVSAAYDRGDKQAAYKILDSKEYLNYKAARTKIQNSNPDFAARYKAENDAKYGTSTSNVSSSSTKSSSSKSSGYSGGYSGSTYSKKPTSSYSTTQWTSAQKKAYGQALDAGKSKSEATAIANGLNNSTKSGYVNPFSLDWTDTRSPFYYAQPQTQKAAQAQTTNSRYPTNTSTTTQKKTVTSSAPGSSTDWDTAQKRAYAQQLAKGKSKAYAAAVANNYYKKKSWNS